jgi:uncharacterized membrane protein
MMTVQPSALAAILLMAVVTYACRAGGYWLLGRVTISPRIAIGFSYLPGAVLISLVAPAMAEEGIPGVCAVAATAIAMWRTNSLLVAMVAGVGTVWVMRQLI